MSRHSRASLGFGVLLRRRLPRSQKKTTPRRLQWPVGTGPLNDYRQPAATRASPFRNSIFDFLPCSIVNVASLPELRCADRTLQSKGRGYFDDVGIDEVADSRPIKAHFQINSNHLSQTNDFNDDWTLDLKNQILNNKLLAITNLLDQTGSHSNQMDNQFM